MAQSKIYLVFGIIVAYHSVALELEVLAPQNFSKYHIHICICWNYDTRFRSTDHTVIRYTNQ